MDLSDLTIDDLEINLEVPASRGRRRQPLVHSFDRELTESDINVLISNPERGSTTPSLIKLKQSHHKLAQLIAEGVPDVEIALITGYAQSRISILKKDPAFAELLAHYSGVQKEIFINVHERLAGMSLDALEELHSRLEEKPEDFSVKELKDLIELGFDRAGYGPKSTQVNEFKFSTDNLLSEVRAEIRKKSDGSIKTLDVRPNQPKTSGYLPPGLGLEIEGEARQHSDLEAERGESRGEEVRKVGGEEATGSVIPFPGREP